MLFYNTSRYICPCGDTFPSGSKSLPSPITHRTLQVLPDLYFCPKCHIPRCSFCCDSAVVSKYCANCMSDYTELPGMTRCTKNCFECPECSSPLAVSIQDDMSQSMGKKFQFSCGHCAYSYMTKTVVKPAPLSTILKQEQPSYFAELQNKYIMSRKLLELKESAGKTHKPQLSRGLLAKMRQMDIKPSSTTTELDDIEKLALSLENFSPRPVDIDADFIARNSDKVPLGNHLTAKNAFSCNLCGTRLLSPIPDPRSMKYLEKEVAPEIMPLVTAKVSQSLTSTLPSFAPSSDTSCVLNVVNPLLSSVNVTVSTLEQIPSSVSGTDYKVAVSLPVTSITIPARREKANLLETIPSVLLTDATQAARGEQLARSMRKEADRRHADPHEPFVEQGLNWVSMPFAVTVYETEDDEIAGESTDEILRNAAQESAPDLRNRATPLRLSLPFYITVETRVPSQWASRGKRGLKYGFWVVCEVE